MHIIVKNAIKRYELSSFVCDYIEWIWKTFLSSIFSFLFTTLLCYSGSRKVVKVTDLKVLRERLRESSARGLGKTGKIRVKHFRSHNSLYHILLTESHRHLRSVLNRTATELLEATEL